MLEINRIYNQDCLEGLKQLEDNVVDLTVTSPPYDNLRSYQDDEFRWDFEIFKPIADELYRVTKPGGIVVWIVGDACINQSETGSSFKQALYFKEIGFKLHDTMLYQKNSSTYPARITSKRYSQVFEYMFIFVKGKIRQDIQLIADKRNKWAGWTSWGKNTKWNQKGELLEATKEKPIPEYSLRTNIWRYTVSFNDKTNHPAVFPEKLAEDHILSWSIEGDLVLDPFMGSGTTAKMAMLNNRNFIGFEKNKDYYEESLIRIGKYIGCHNDKVIQVDTLVKNEDNGLLENNELQVNDSETDKELDGKIVLWNKLIAELNEYFNEQTLGILKNLKFTFSSKSNDAKVEQLIKERGLNTEIKQDKVEDKETIKNEEKSLKMPNFDALISLIEQQSENNKIFYDKVIEILKNDKVNDNPNDSVHIIVDNSIKKLETKGVLDKDGNFEPIENKVEEKLESILPDYINDKIKNGNALDLVDVQSMKSFNDLQFNGNKRVYKNGTRVIIHNDIDSLNNMIGWVESSYLVLGDSGYRIYVIRLQDGSVHECKENQIKRINNRKNV